MDRNPDLLIRVYLVTNSTDAGCIERPLRAGHFNARYKTRFHSHIPGGFFSADPDNLRVHRSIRTNNPGALNYSNWQRLIAGFVGMTNSDTFGNRTTIYASPESGIAAWYHLLTVRYRRNKNGILNVENLAQFYAGTPYVTGKAALSYLHGWNFWSNAQLRPKSSLNFGRTDEFVRLARAMFAHEAGRVSPLSERQILFGINNHLRFFNRGR